MLVLGDSFTYGSGVPDESAPFPRVIERTLGGVEVLNGGLPASLPGQWLRLWRGAGRRFEPDAVVIVFFLRDGTRISSRGMFDEVRASDLVKVRLDGKDLDDKGETEIGYRPVHLQPLTNDVQSVPPKPRVY